MVSGGFPRASAPPGNAAGSAIALSHISKIFHSLGGAVVALEQVDLSIAPGEFIALLGPSGCGKTTLLRILAGLETASDGKVVIDGVEVAAPIDGVSFVFQTSVLLPWRTVIENVLLPAEIAGSVDARWTAKAQALLRTAGLEGFEQHRPQELSGGMRQRVSLCRALLMDPKLLLMDEPFGALDAMTRDAMNEELHRLWKATGKTIVFVTHDIAEAVRLATRIVVMTVRPGRVACVVQAGFDDEIGYEERVKSARASELAIELRQMFRPAAYAK
jgi:NitT/TauT family transport system ATP-binding protein